jgi:hypothetical protein
VASLIINVVVRLLAGGIIAASGPGLGVLASYMP